MHLKLCRYNWPKPSAQSLPKNINVVLWFKPEFEKFLYLVYTLLRVVNNSKHFIGCMLKEKHVSLEELRQLQSQRDV